MMDEGGGGRSTHSAQPQQRDQDELLVARPSFDHVRSSPICNWHKSVFMVLLVLCCSFKYFLVFCGGVKYFLVLCGSLKYFVVVSSILRCSMELLSTL